VSTMTKVFIVLTAVLSIAVSCLFIAAAAQMANWRKLAETYQERQLAEFTHRVNLQAIMEASLALKDEALREKAQALEAAQKQVRDLDAALVDARSQLAREMADRVTAEAGRKKLEELLDVQTAEQTALRKQNQMLLTQNIDLQTRNTRLNSRVLELTAANAVLTDQTRNLQEKLYAAEQKLSELEQALALGRRVPAAAAPAGVVPVAAVVAGPIRGEIVKVEGSYASINIGQSSGVVPGMTFMVYRGAAFLAELVIDEVRPDEAGGKLKTIKEAVRPGDSVVYGLESAGR
jgi:hypothetical protein